MLFTNLPDDVLVIIVKYVDRDIRTLAILASCCKKLYQITTPILYSHVALDLEDADESRKVRCFIKSVLYNPFLGQCVRSLELNPLYWVSHYLLSLHRKNTEGKVGDYRSSRPDSLELLKLIALIQRMPLPEEHRRRWCMELQEMSPSLDSLIAILLFLLPSLQRLESNWSSDAVFISHLLLTTSKNVDSLPSPNVLANLTHVKVASQSACGDFSEILPFFQMPSMTHFFASNWGPIRRDDWNDGAEEEAGNHEDDEDDQIPGSQIVHLELRYCNIDLFSLQMIIRRCRSVRTFILHRDWDPRVHVKFSAFSIIQAILPLWETLENILLSFEPGIYIHEEQEISPLDFSRFPVLTKLYVSAGYIIHDPEDFDPQEFSKFHEADAGNVNSPLRYRLPRSLEVLRIMGFSTPEQTQFLIDDCCQLIQHRVRFPRLRELCIEGRFRDNDITFDISGLQDEARRAGVRLRRIDNTEIHIHDKEDVYTPTGCDWGMDGEFRWGTKFFDYDLVELVEEKVLVD